MKYSPARTAPSKPEGYTNPFQVKLPLLRVAHPSDADKTREIEKVRTEIAKTNLIQSAESDGFKPSTKGVPTQAKAEHNPSLFNFDHCYDPALTPRKGWQQKVTHLEALYEQEREKVQISKTEAQNTKTELERQLLVLSTKLKESDS